MNKLFNLLTLSGLYLLFIIPSLEIISSAPSDFQNIWKTMGILLYIYIFTSFLLIIIFKKISLKKQIFFIYFMMFLLVYFLSNYYFFTGNYGLMDYFVFHNDDVFDISYNAIIQDVFIAILLAILAIIILKVLSLKSIETMTIFIFLALLIASIKFIYTINADIKPIKKYEHIKRDIKNTAKNKLQKEITFSKNGNNVLILFFDRFMGGLIPEILKNNPNLNKELNGFVWYPNTLSFGSGTAVGLAPIYGGYKFTNAQAMLDTNYKWDFRIYDSKYMKDRYETSTKFMLEKFYNKGYDVSIFDANFLSESQLSSMSNNTFKFKSIRANKDYLNTFYYSQELDQKDNKKSPFAMIKEYIMPFSIFKVISPSLRKNIYNNGVWYAGLSSTSMNYIEVIREISYARAWGYISEVKNNSKGTFNFITSNLAHHVPVNRNMNNTFQGVIPKYSPLDEKKFKNKYSASHYYLAQESLIRANSWFKWLKKNNIYNNTKIIITADHGASSAFNPMFKTQKNENGINYGSYHPILMVKDFNQTDNIKINNDFMTHADTPYLALSAIDKNAHKKYGYDKSKGFRLYTHHKDKGSLVVFDNIFNADNWIYKKE